MSLFYLNYVYILYNISQKYNVVLSIRHGNVQTKWSCKKSPSVDKGQAPVPCLCVKYSSNISFFLYQLRSIFEKLSFSP